jgi:hypothetical protein
MVSTNIKAMKSGQMVWIFLIFISGWGIDCFAQNASSNASATIINPVSISKNVNSEFGNVAVIVSGTIEMSQVNKGSSKGNISLPASSGTFTAASYYFTGREGYSFTVSTPTSPLIVKNGQNLLHVVSFESSPVQNENSGSIAGVYISVSPSRVTVNYN